MVTKLFIVALWWCLFFSHSIEFTDPVIISGEGKFTLSSHARRNLVATNNGKLFVTYWSEDGSVSPGSPSLAYVQKRTSSRSWSNPIRVNKEFGARHSSLLLTDKALHVTWHDYRHCSSHSNWMDQVEIYYNKFCLEEYPDSQGNIRITSPEKHHAGNNRFVPVPFLLDNDEIGLVWYDFYFDGHCSEIFFTGTSRGDWETDLEHSTLNLTKADEERPPYTMPDATFDGKKTHIAWTDTTNWKGNLYYGIKEDKSFRYKKVASQTSSYFDPPRIYVIHDTPYILTTAFNENNESRIVALEMDSSKLEVSASHELTPFDGRYSQPVMAVLNDTVTISWIHNSRKVFLAQFAYDDWNETQELLLFEKSRSDQSMKVSLATDSEEILYALWNYQGDIYFTSTELPTSVENFQLFQ